MSGQIVANPAQAGIPTTVASTAAAGGATLLAANSARLGATIYNDSTQVLYLLLSSATPTSSVFTVAMAAASYYEVPFRYTGAIKGIWASANGNARIVEFS